MFAPLTRPDRVRKALAVSPAIADLEDAVGAGEKDTARCNLADLLHTAPRGRLSIRINDSATEVGRADVTELARYFQSTSGVVHEDVADTSVAPFAVMVPKAESAGQIMSIAEKLPRIPIVALVETARGVANSTELALCAPVVRLALGALDLAMELGCQRQGAVMSLARANVVLSSRLGNLPAPLDSPEPDIHNSAAAQRAAQQAITDGFGGMLCLHPAQTQVIADAYRPSDADIAWAKDVLAIPEGVGTLGGEMVDRPVKLRAEQILKDAGRGTPSQLPPGSV